VIVVDDRGGEGDVGEDAVRAVEPHPASTAAAPAAKLITNHERIGREPGPKTRLASMTVEERAVIRLCRRSPE
jgi:hypothetical protein